MEISQYYISRLQSLESSGINELRELTKNKIQEGMFAELFKVSIATFAGDYLLTKYSTNWAVSGFGHYVGTASIVAAGVAIIAQVYFHAKSDANSIILKLIAEEAKKLEKKLGIYDGEKTVTANEVNSSETQDIPPIENKNGEESVSQKNELEAGATDPIPVVQ